MTTYCQHTIHWVELSVEPWMRMSVIGADSSILRLDGVRETSCVVVDAGGGTGPSVEGRTARCELLHVVVE